MRGHPPKTHDYYSSGESGRKKYEKNHATPITESIIITTPKNNMNGHHVEDNISSLSTESEYLDCVLIPAFEEEDTHFIEQDTHFTEHDHTVDSDSDTSLEMKYILIENSDEEDDFLPNNTSDSEDDVVYITTKHVNIFNEHSDLKQVHSKDTTIHHSKDTTIHSGKPLITPRQLLNHHDIQPLHNTQLLNHHDTQPSKDSKTLQNTKIPKKPSSLTTTTTKHLSTIPSHSQPRTLLSSHSTITKTSHHDNNHMNETTNSSQKYKLPRVREERLLQVQNESSSVNTSHSNTLQNNNSSTTTMNNTIPSNTLQNNNSSKRMTSLIAPITRSSSNFIQNSEYDLRQAILEHGPFIASNNNNNSRPFITSNNNSNNNTPSTIDDSIFKKNRMNQFYNIILNMDITVDEKTKLKKAELTRQDRMNMMNQLKTIPNSFKSIEEYVNIFTPHILQECVAQIQSSINEDRMESIQAMIKDIEFKGSTCILYLSIINHSSITSNSSNNSSISSISNNSNNSNFSLLPPSIAWIEPILSHQNHQQQQHQQQHHHSFFCEVLENDFQTSKNLSIRFKDLISLRTSSKHKSCHLCVGSKWIIRKISLSTLLRQIYAVNSIGIFSLNHFISHPSNNNNNTTNINTNNNNNNTNNNHTSNNNTNQRINNIHSNNSMNHYHNIFLNPSSSPQCQSKQYPYSYKDLMNDELFKLHPKYKMFLKQTFNESQLTGIINACVNTKIPLSSQQQQQQSNSSSSRQQQPQQPLPQQQQQQPQQPLSPLVLIQGPPGTGKTTLSIGIISTLIQQRIERGEAIGKNKILVCAPSNQAVDEILKRISEKGITVMTMNTTSHDSTLNSTLNTHHSTITTYIPQMVRFGIKESIHPSVEHYYMDHLIKNRMNDQRNDRMDSTTMNHYTMNQLEFEIKQSIMKSVEIIFVTLSSSGFDKYFNLNISESISHIIIDECCQCVEPELLIPLCYLSNNNINTSNNYNNYSNINTSNNYNNYSNNNYGNNRNKNIEIPNHQKIILIGDPCQLPATIIGNSRDYNYSRSLMERFMNEGYPAIMLNVQHRMHPKICEFPSQCFYGGKLTSHESLNDHPIGKEYQEIMREMNHDDRNEWNGKKTTLIDSIPPIQCYDLLYSREDSHNTTSVRNVFEAQFISYLYYKMIHLKMKKLMKNPKYDRNDETHCMLPSQLLANFEKNIGIITPYKQQVNEIRKCINTIPTTTRRMDTTKHLTNGENNSTDINTIDGFQGREKDVILLSCVRSEGLGFLTDYRRMNVAITRAKHGLIVVCNSKQLNNSPLWREFIAHAQQNGYYHAVTQPPKDIEKIQREVQFELRKLLTTYGSNTRIVQDEMALIDNSHKRKDYDQRDLDSIGMAQHQDSQQKKKRK
ncbi:hypothetical protein C9374_009880 [Naegleria lovaniensis]|uniref:Uncharacterized protein n=1 Tax=Naegleria lovaniensis TaxID=51637 RepID=A0AA88GCZ1_NAELO|nr:uncharacterized protein C9374_009880 [Naegleria lovaniensis]KAG2375257.1 hypothetical protein C9374_009880 [Naegleria lovaniensis]